MTPMTQQTAQQRLSSGSEICCCHNSKNRTYYEFWKNLIPVHSRITRLHSIVTSLCLNQQCWSPLKIYLISWGLIENWFIHVIRSITTKISLWVYFPKYKGGFYERACLKQLFLKREFSGRFLKGSLIG